MLLPPHRLSLSPLSTHPDARTLAGQLDGGLAGIYGGPTTGRDTAVPADLAAPHGLFLIGYLDDVAVACGGCGYAGTCRTPS